MIKLKSIVNEIEFESGHYGSKKSWLMLEEFLKNYDFVPERAAMKILSYVDNTKGDEPLPKELQQILIDSFDEILKKSGKLYILRKDAGLNHYVCFDFSKPARGGLFFIGKMITMKFNKQFGYSPQKQFGFDKVENIKLSEVAANYRGQGYGSKLYDALLGYVDAVFSDDLLYQGSYNVWINHIRKRSKFFGVLINADWTQTILPIYNEETLKKSKLSDPQIKGFVGIIKSPPAQLLKLKTFLDGINPDEVFVLDTEPRNIPKNKILDFVIDAIEDSVSSEDLLNQEEPEDDNKPWIYFDVNDDYWIGRKNTNHFKAAFIPLDFANIYIKEVADGLEWFLL